MDKKAKIIAGVVIGLLVVAAFLIAHSILGNDGQIKGHWFGDSEGKARYEAKLAEQQGDVVESDIALDTLDEQTIIPQMMWSSVDSMGNVPVVSLGDPKDFSTDRKEYILEKCSYQIQELDQALFSSPVTTVLGSEINYSSDYSVKGFGRYSKGYSILQTDHAGYVFRGDELQAIFALQGFTKSNVEYLKSNYPSSVSVSQGFLELVSDSQYELYIIEKLLDYSKEEI